MAIEAVVADTGPLIALARVDGLNLLPQVFTIVWVTPAVIDECLAKPDHPEGIAIRTAVQTGVLRPTPAPHDFDERQGLGPGESSAITWAIREKTAVLVDDRLARRAATEAGLTTIGTLGVLVACKRRGLIASIRPAVATLRNTGYFLSGLVIDEALRLAGEDDLP